MIERETFARKIILFHKLEDFGFIRTNGEYVLEKKIFDGMIARISVDSLGNVSGEVFDEDFGEPYVNFRNQAAEGAFVVGVRNAYNALLSEIAECCTEKKVYVGDQPNAINRLIFERYGVRPEFLWKRFPYFGVYRNETSRKWFAIIMNVGRDKVVKGESGEVEVMNLKLDDCAKEYLQKGVYPSYHMNHKSWVTVLLDGALPDAIIAEMLSISYKNSFKTGKRK